MDTQFSLAITFLICLCSLFPKLFPSSSFLKLATPSAALPQLLTWQYSSLENRSNQTWIPLYLQHLNHQTNPSCTGWILFLLFTDLSYFHIYRDEACPNMCTLQIFYSSLWLNLHFLYVDFFVILHFLFCF